MLSVGWMLRWIGCGLAVDWRFGTRGLVHYGKAALGCFAGDSRGERSEFLDQWSGQGVFEFVQGFGSQNTVERSVIAQQNDLAVAVGIDRSEGQAGGRDERMMCIECSLAA